MSIKAIHCVILLVFVLSPAIGLADAMSDTRIQVSQEKCGYGPHGNKVYLNNVGTRSLKATVKFNSSDARSIPRSEEVTVDASSRVYVGCTKTVMRNGPTYTHTVQSAEYVD
jgi:hypothetical protein